MAHSTTIRSPGPRHVVSEVVNTRPANTTQYAAGDVVGQDPAANLVFAECASLNGGGGAILGVRVVDSIAPATKADLELWIFDEAPAAVADNAAFAPTDAEMLHLVGVIDLTGTPVVAGANCTYEVRGLRIPFVCKSDSRNLYGVLVERGTYTPGSAETHAVRLEILQDA